ncbi:hypothetical protein PCYB_112950 [Plasmodium cynomolgi strain B]|uniref:Uncharacterized protein n=1 Tax=Plasmodium cynomolgi (strain B) TaxID=1120755 RepID=K6UUW7_PLACD|nr:hypothetical protein PCYB_112950 [Plasmodium cynomolgi strain B]GAB67274.1 hypothetical protein PCYB_112950 [Plasmodium cynomolgi strain B]
MKLHAEFKPDGIDDFSHILKGLKDFSSFAMENSFLCFKFSEKYLYIFGNEKKHVEIFIKISMDDLFYDNFILKSATDNEIIILVYIFQIYDIFKNVSKSTKITIDLFDKNGICILLFKHQCSVNKNAFSINCKLKKCCKILNTYSKFQADKVELNFNIANKHCDVVFLLDSITTKNVTTLKNNYVLKDFMDKQAKQEKDQNNGKFHLKKVIYIKTLTKALNILNECRNNKDDVGIFKIIVPYNKCWFALKLGQFESSGNWKVLIVITDLSLDL